VFSKICSPAAVEAFLAMYELFKMVLHVKVPSLNAAFIEVLG